MKKAWVLVALVINGLSAWLHLNILYPKRYYTIYMTNRKNL